MKNVKVFKIKDGKRFFKSLSISVSEDGEVVITPVYCLKEEYAAWYIEDYANTYKDYFKKRKVSLIFVKEIPMNGGKNRRANSKSNTNVS